MTRADSPEAEIALVGAGGARLAARKTPGNSPTVVFLGGFTSDMTGSKATRMAAACARRGQAFLRFDYRGHGQSDGDFAAFTIGDWLADALAAIDQATEGPLLLVGSSMGGWLMLLAALERPERVVGMVGLAAAPDFTEDLVWARATPEQKSALQRDGFVTEPSSYGPPTIYTMNLIEEGRRRLLLGRTIPIAVPVRLLQGMRDDDVPWRHAIRLVEALAGADVRLTLIKDGNHRLSREEDLDLLETTVFALLDELA